MSVTAANPNHSAICDTGDLPDATDTYRDLEALLGRPRMRDLLAGLRREIDRRFDPQSGSVEDLARDAHALIPVSGLLGFASLSQACVALEGACLGGGDVSASLHVALLAAERARDVIDAIRVSDGPDL